MTTNRTCLTCRQPIANSARAHYGLHEECFTKNFGVSASEEFKNFQIKSNTSSDSSSSKIVSQDTSFFHGTFKKYSAELAGNSYILKMRQSDAPELPEVEYLCNQIGKALKIPVSTFYYIDLYGDKVFVTKNFMKSGSAPSDLQHIYHFRAGNEHNCEKIINVIAEQTNRPYDVKIFIKTILFDALIGNHDRHGRNLAFIVTRGSRTLSPIYDNVSYLGLESGEMLKADFNPAGKVSTNATIKPSMGDYVKELKKLGYDQIIVKFYQSIKFAHIDRLIDESYCSSLMKDAFKRLIAKRLKELQNELQN